MDSIEHYHTSATRIYMAILMVSPMSVIMIATMGKMYPNKKLNSTIVAGSIMVFIIFLIALRTQTPIGDVQYMKGMISHHSSAIMTSKHADIKDREVRILADSIIQSQQREIKQMENLLSRLNH